MKMQKENSPTPILPRDDLQSPDPADRSGRLDRKLAQKLLDLMGVKDLKLCLWDGYEAVTPGGDGSVEVVFHDRAALYLTLWDPDLKFGELYAAGRIDVRGDLIKGLEQFYRSFHDADKSALSSWRRLYHGSQGQRNTVHNAKHNIHHHYDVGNEFYMWWLEKEMQYTCAYYPRPDADLETAQIAKMDHVCRKLCLQRGQSVVEAGCGWGGLARHMATRYGVKVRSFNISHEQIVYARQRAVREGYADSVEYVEDDYRNMNGKYDRFVSIGMLEHVGKGRYKELGEVIHNALSKEGMGLIHSIGQMAPRPTNAWLKKHIFPGGYPPSLGEMMEIFEADEFSVMDVENLRLHYARTCQHWLERLENHAEQIIDKYDERFYRTYRLYLAGSSAAFLGGGLQLFQIVFARRGYNAIPWTRDYLYKQAEA